MASQDEEIGATTDVGDGVAGRGMGTVTGDDADDPRPAPGGAAGRGGERGFLLRWRNRPLRVYCK